MTLNLKKTWLTTLLSLAIFFPILAQKQYLTQSQQKQTNTNFWDKVYFGGDFGLGFGTTTLINISPLMGYKFTEDLSAGVGITYLYYKDASFSPAFETNTYGGRLFGRYYLPFMPNIFAHAEYEVLNYDFMMYDPYYNLFTKSRVTAHNFLIGGGYSQPVGENASIDAMILYNLNENAESLYQNPIIRVGINFGR